MIYSWRYVVSIYFKQLFLNKQCIQIIKKKNTFHVIHILFPEQGLSPFTLYRKCKPWSNKSNVSAETQKAQFTPISLASYPSKCNSQWDRDVGLGISPNCASVATGMSGSVWKRDTDLNKHTIIFAPFIGLVTVHTTEWWAHNQATDRGCEAVRCEHCALDCKTAASIVATYMLLFVLFMPCNSVSLFLGSSSLVQRCWRRGTRDAVKPVVVQSCKCIYCGPGLILQHGQMTHIHLWILVKISWTFNNILCKILLFSY